MYVPMTWVHREGERNAEMVWLDPDSCFRTTCVSQGAEAYHNSFYEHVALWKIRVRPVPGADLQAKRVGIVKVRPGTEPDETELAGFFAVRDDGTEEWQIARRWGSTGGDTAPGGSEAFLVWYQDGAGHTYYDDHDGQLHTARW